MRTKGNSLWCSIKHTGAAIIHLEESLEKLYRMHDIEKASALSSELSELRNIREEIINKYGKLSEQELGIDATCPRCEEDLKVLTKNLNISNDLHTNNSNTHTSEKPVRGDKMLSLKEVGLINAGQFVGKGVTMLADFIDEKQGVITQPTGTSTATPLYKRPSVWINLGLGLGAQLLGVYGFKTNETAQLLSVVAGSHTLTKVLDYIKEYAQTSTQAPTAGLRVRPIVRAAPAPTSVGSSMVKID